MRVIIAGKRDITDFWLVAHAMTQFLERYPFPTEIVSGECRGTDRLGERWAKELGVPIKRFPYEAEYGLAGGPIRNGKMAAYADALVALWDGLSSGTGDMIKQARAKGLIVFVYRV